MKYHLFGQSSELKDLVASIGAPGLGTVRVLCVGDVVGASGINLCKELIPSLKNDLSITMVVANGENSANDGRGITIESFNGLKNSLVDVVTTGNHVWKHNRFYPFLESDPSVVRPLNFPKTCPGKGLTVFQAKISGQEQAVKIGVVNVMGRAFMREYTDCPYLTIENAISELEKTCKIIILDIHAESTSEKISLGLYFDGRISAIVGTHTHVQTADARILGNGTGFITDLGSVSSLNSCIGMAKEEVIQGQITQMPTKYKVDGTLPMVFSGVIFDIDAQTGHCQKVFPIRIEQICFN